MKTWTIRGAPSPVQLDQIAALLRSGGIVLMPTDTIYGLHGLANDETAGRIAAIKGREQSKRFVIIAASVEQLESLGVEVPPALRKVWPAPLTGVLRRRDSTIAARIPDLGWLRDLLERTGPLFSTSANPSGQPPIAAPDHLSAAMRDAIDGIVEGGRREGKASAIVDFTETEPRLIREGDPRFTQILRKTQSKKL